MVVVFVAVENASSEKSCAVDGVSTLTAIDGAVRSACDADGVSIFVAVELRSVETDGVCLVDQVSTLTAHDGVVGADVGQLNEVDGVCKLLRPDVTASSTSVLQKDCINPGGTDVRGGVGRAGALNGSKSQGF